MQIRKNIELTHTKGLIDLENLLNKEALLKKMVIFLWDI